MASKNAPSPHLKLLAVLIDATKAPFAIAEGLFEKSANTISPVWHAPTDWKENVATQRSNS